MNQLYIAFIEGKPIKAGSYEACMSEIGAKNENGWFIPSDFDCSIQSATVNEITELFDDMHNELIDLEFELASKDNKIADLQHKLSMIRSLLH